MCKKFLSMAVMAAISVSAMGAGGLAFPGAEGYGKYTRGGRGGQ